MRFPLTPNACLALATGFLGALCVTSTPVRGGQGQESDDARHWAYVAPLRPRVPAVVDEDWARNDIDRFVLARLEREGLRPSPAAERTTLARRVALDLIGLPPDPEEVDAFVADDAPDAYERYVDRLLASPHFGERWARHWLDLARYADSDGYAFDFPRSIWPYRDWVVEAFNRDLPFDEFTVLQLAGDLLPGAGNAERIATGFHRNTMVNSEGGINDEEFRIEAIKDRVDTTATVWLGSTLACAQCHHHKYDPFTQFDYYRLFAFFNDTVDRGSLPSGVLELPTDEELAQRERVGREVAALEEELLAPDPTLDEAQRAWERETLARYAVWSTPVTSAAEADGGILLEPQADGSFLAAGANPERATYVLTMATALERVTALRLELLPDPTLPAGGPGRAPDGNFTLSMLRLRVTTREGETGPPLPWGSPTASHEQKLSKANFWPIDSAVDGEPITGWAIIPNVGRVHEAVFPLAEPLALMAGEHLVLELDQLRGGQHTLGRLRVTLSDSSAPPSARTMAEADLHAILERAEDARSATESATVRGHYRHAADETASLRARIAELRATLPAPVTTLMLQALETPRATRLLRRGSFLDPGKPVEPDVPAILPALEPAGERATRLDLARWLVAPGQPLTHRVFVNRVWQRLFGRGLVATENDFGTRGSAPSHPALLDWLALKFVSDGQSMKRLIRGIVTSATYRQSSMSRPAVAALDPSNRLLARQVRQRVEAEVLRDAALVASGLLDPRLGGPPVQPPHPPGTDDFSTLPKEWTVSEGGDRYRRTLYTLLWRTNPHPFLTTFDFANPTSTCTRRNRANTPLQALTMANDPMLIELAGGLARRVLLEGHASDAERLRRAFRLSVSRPPDAAEEQILLELLEAERLGAASNATSTLAVGAVLPPPEIDAATFQAWTSVARVLFNLDEFVTRE